MRTTISISLAAILLIALFVSPAWSWSSGSTGICSDHSGRNFPCSSGTQDDDWERYTNDDYHDTYDPTPLSRAIDLYNEGNRYLRSGQYAQAESLYRQAISLYSRKSYFHNNLGAALFYQGRLDEAVDEFVMAGRLGDRKAAKYAKELRAYLRGRATQETIDRLWEQHKYLHNDENYQAAAAAMREVIVLLKKQDSYTARDKASAYFQLWRSLYAMCRDHPFESQAKISCLRPALDAMTQGYRLMPGDALFAEGLSLTLYYMDRHEESALMLVESWRKGADTSEIITILKDHLRWLGTADSVYYMRALLEVSPDDTDTREWVGQVLLNIVQYNSGEDSVMIARELVDVFPDRVSSHVLLGSTLMENGDMRAGRKAFAKAAKLEPENYYPRAQLGYALYQAEHYAEAVDAYKEAIALSHGDMPDSNRDDLYYFLARNLEGMGDLVGAEEAFQHAIQIDSADGWNHLLYGEFLERRGRYVAAERSMDTAVRIGEEPEKMRERLDQFLVRQGREAMDSGQYEAAELYLRRSVSLGNEEVVDALASARMQAAAKVNSARQSRAQVVDGVVEQLRITPFAWSGKQSGMQERELRPSGGTDTSAGKQVKSAKVSGIAAAEAFSGEGAVGRGRLTFDTQGVSTRGLSTSSVVLGKAPSSEPAALPEITQAQRQDTIMQSLMGRHVFLTKELAKQAAKTARTQAQLDDPSVAKPSTQGKVQAPKTKAEKQVELVKEREKEDQLKSKLLYIRLSVLDRLKQLKAQRAKGGSNDKK